MCVCAISRLTASRRKAPLRSWTARSNIRAYWVRALASSPARSSADTQAPGDANGSAATTAFSPQRVSIVRAPPREAGRGRPRICTLTNSVSSERASSRSGSSWLPAMTTICAPDRPTRTRNRFTSCSASAGGFRLSKTSPVWRTRSTACCSMKAARWSSTASSSSRRWIPFHRRPTCQSLVWTIFMVGVFSGTSVRYKRGARAALGRALRRVEFTGSALHPGREGHA